jgi:hypothetical protein
MRKHLQDHQKFEEEKLRADPLKAFLVKRINLIASPRFITVEALDAIYSYYQHYATGCLSLERH